MPDDEPLQESPAAQTPNDELIESISFNSMFPGANWCPEYVKREPWWEDSYKAFAKAIQSFVGQ